ncbi:mitochondrial ATP synthase F1, epsilon subunit, putative [Plasmodium malariae]|uniref:Mitochondrial ATP synthase F1, epsilon subunit, putative n=1 Tax=Plasmodium malariae TaxID=5858 RepID=A0A1C3L2F9_PLAMA|nr:mitochondrial ATP synthase F1, epsilon subunit, putative [Plasmodium malariae]SBT80755.1 mitochondrial ATP synthase F1, epsilon subunit, putative [Plasmodium malariae]SCP03348.1 mitochondrial ATP synthase F1, epsilon subunit, putative [Plasmodium malariae]
MWKAANVSYTRYASEMADILRRCLKDPYADIALERSKMHLRETIYKDGKPISQELHDEFQKAFKNLYGGKE